MELEQWVVCVRQLEDVLVLQTLMLVPSPQGTAGGAAAQCSLKALLEGGTGGVERRIFWRILCFVTLFHFFLPSFLPKHLFFLPAVSKPYSTLSLSAATRWLG